MSAYSHASCNSNITHTAPDSQYELLNNNTEVKDKQTGLIWQRCKRRLMQLAALSTLGAAALLAG